MPLIPYINAAGLRDIRIVVTTLGDLEWRARARHVWQLPKGPNESARTAGARDGESDSRRPAPIGVTRIACCGCGAQRLVDTWPSTTPCSCCEDTRATLVLPTRADRHVVEADLFRAQELVAAFARELAQVDAGVCTR